MVHFKAIVARDTDKHQSSSQARHLGAPLDRMVGPRRFDGNIDTAALSCLEHSCNRLLLVKIDGNGPELFGNSQTPRELVYDIDRLRAGCAHGLQQAEPN